MRITIIGDMQYNDEPNKEFENFCNDVNSLNSDLIICLGDYGRGCDLGTGKGMYEVADITKKLNSTFIPMLGNHDMQLETGKNRLPHGTTHKTYKKAFGIDACNRFLEFDSFRLFVINIDPQPNENFSIVNECYVSEQNFYEIKKQIRERPGLPVVMVTHAPPIGSGISTVPSVHVRAVNAFMDQNNNPIKWYNLYKEFSEIVLWFSGHYHIGHNHQKSISYKEGTTFFTTGVCTSASRDGTRHSRVIDIESDNVSVKTFDHSTHKICEKDDWSSKENIAGLLNEKHTNKRVKVNNVSVLKDFSTGCGVILKNRLILGKNGLLYAQTDNDYVWEIDLLFEEAMGTLNHPNAKHIDRICADDEYVWCYSGELKYGHRYSDPNRFMRTDNYNSCNCVVDSSKAATHQFEVNTRFCDLILIDGVLNINKKYNYSCEYGEITAFCVLAEKESVVTVCVAVNDCQCDYTRYMVIEFRL